MSSIQHGHAKKPLILQPERTTYAGNSCESKHDPNELKFLLIERNVNKQMEQWLSVNNFLGRLVLLEDIQSNKTDPTIVKDIEWTPFW